MRLIAKFFVEGKPQPWRVPDIDWDKKGKPGFLKPQPRQREWQETVHLAALKAMAGAPPVHEFDVRLTMEFVFATPCGSREGERCSQRVVRTSKGRYIKPRDCHADLTNLFKLAEDGLQLACIGDDAQVTESHPSQVYGPKPGVWITVEAFPPRD